MYWKVFEIPDLCNSLGQQKQRSPKREDLAILKGLPFLNPKCPQSGDADSQRLEQKGEGQSEDLWQLAKGCPMASLLLMHNTETGGLEKTRHLDTFPFLCSPSIPSCVCALHSGSEEQRSKYFWVLLFALLYLA